LPGQLADQVASDEPRCPGNEDRHCLESTILSRGVESVACKTN
jgi:hypothetical protein